MSWPPLFSSTYCDDADPIERVPVGQALQVTSDRLQHRFDPRILEFANTDIPLDSPLLIVDRSIIKQRITGWGGAFTDAAAINIASLNQTTQDNLLRWANLDF